MSNRVEHQKLNQVAAELPPGWVFGVQLGLRQTQALIKTKTIRRGKVPPARHEKLIWSDREISSSQNLPPENPKICLRQFFQCCDSCSVLPPSSFRRLRRLEFCPRIFTDGFAVWILPPTGSLFGASGAKKLQLYLLEPSAREFASGLKICLRRSSLHFSSVLHPC